MKTKFLLIAMLLIGVTIQAQQDAQYTQYMYNTITINPAYAGSTGNVSIFGLYRTQWVGLDGAPQTGTFSVNAPIEGTHLGIGISVITDKIGPTNDNTFAVDLSYTVKTSESYKLAFGLKASANLFNLDVNKLNAKDQTDPLLQDLNNYFTPNLGAGIFFYSDNTYFGLSVPKFLETKRYDDNTVAVYAERMHYYFIGGHVFDLSPSIKFKPAFLTKLVQGAPLQVDLSGNFMYNEKFVLGAAYRWDAAMSLMAGFQVSPNLFLGYGYDLETTRLRNYSSGSHEFYLRYDFSSKVDKMISPRFF